jgi:hypothetical protein
MKHYTQPRTWTDCFAGCCECGDEPSVSGDTDLVNYYIKVFEWNITFVLTGLQYCYYYCLWGGITYSAPHTATITDLLLFPIKVLVISDSELSGSNQQRHLVSKQEETWREISVNLAYKYLFQ